MVSSSGLQAHELLPHVHMVASLSKRWLLGTHQGSWSPEQLDFDEYTFRYNRRRSKNRALLFYRLIENAVVTDPQPYRSLVAFGPESKHPHRVKRDQRQTGERKHDQNEL